MLLSIDEEKAVRSYLLGELGPQDAQALEERLLREEDFVEELLLLEDELIEDYARGALTPGERARFESHFLSTPKRRRKLMLVNGIRKYAAERSAQADDGRRDRASSISSLIAYLFTPKWRAVAVALLLVAVGVGAWSLFFRVSEVDKGMIALNDAYRKQRPLEARITGLSYAPFMNSRGNAQSDVDYRARDLSVILLLDAASKEQSAKALHAAGRLYMAQKEFDKAILQFQEALKSSPNDAQLHADLGAAMLEQAKLLRDRNEDGKVMDKLLESQQHLDEALRLNHSLPEASFNKALCLEEMLMPGQAREAWQNYLKLDPNSKWADEARHHLRDISELRSAPPTPSQLLGNFVVAFDAQAWRILSGSREVITRRIIPPQLAHDYAARALERADEPARESLP
jgi:tetratricopeptide (TPR) repeat protein